MNDTVRNFQIDCLTIALGNLAMARTSGLNNAIIDVATLKIGQVVDHLKQGETSVPTGEKPISDFRAGWVGSEERRLVEKL